MSEGPEQSVGGVEYVYVAIIKYVLRTFSLNRLSELDLAVQNLF